MYRVMAIDPGANFMGVAIMDFDVYGLHLVNVETFNISRILDLGYYDLLEYREPPFIKQVIVQDITTSVLETFNPNVVIVEDSYFSRLVAPFVSLRNCLLSIERAVFLFDKTLRLNKVEPSKVKQCAGVDGNTGDKDLMTKALYKLDINNLPDLSTLDEHSVDATLIAYYQIQQILRMIQ